MRWQRPDVLAADIVARNPQLKWCDTSQRGYMAEPDPITHANWPSPIDSNPAIRPVLEQVIAATLDFAKGQA